MTEPQSLMPDARYPSSSMPASPASSSPVTTGITPRAFYNPYTRQSFLSVSPDGLTPVARLSDTSPKYFKPMRVFWGVLIVFGGLYLRELHQTYTMHMDELRIEPLEEANERRKRERAIRRQRSIQDSRDTDRRIRQLHPFVTDDRIKRILESVNSEYSSKQFKSRLS